jgi:solute carrier family 25 protein 39/40
MAIPATVVYFVGYESIRNRLQRSTLLPFSTDIMSPSIAGSTARILAATMISPLELIRTNMQHQGQTGTIRAVMSQIVGAVKRDGSGVLWKGLVPTLWRDVPFSALYWTGYEGLRKRLRPRICPKSSPLRETGLSFASGALSGAFAAIATTPFDVAKTRKQISVGNSAKATSLLLEGSPRGMFPQLAEIWREEGPRGLFKGVGPRILKVAPACAIMIGSYEFGKAFFRQSLVT